MKTLLDTAKPLTQGEIVDSVLAEQKQRQEQLFAAVIAEMTADEGFRRRVLDKAKELGMGKRGAQKPSPGQEEGVRRIVDLLRHSGKQKTLEALALTFNLERKQAERLYKAASARRQIHHCL